MPATDDPGRGRLPRTRRRNRCRTARSPQSARAGHCSRGRESADEGSWCCLRACIGPVDLGARRTESPWQVFSLKNTAREEVTESSDQNSLTWNSAPPAQSRYGARRDGWDDAAKVVRARLSWRLATSRHLPSRAAVAGADPDPAPRSRRRVGIRHADAARTARGIRGEGGGERGRGGVLGGGGAGPLRLRASRTVCSGRSWAWGL